ncbi:MAG: thermosome subunit beta [Candidatus Bathyarchaeota archaeon]|nr:thermosome subunit beta [Candidatus Bathyarchaeota archaeon]
MMAQAISAQIGGQPVLILREGTQRSLGRGAQRSNIMAARVISETLKSALGPKGMDKMLVNSFGDATITSDGATILDEMDIEHPAAKMMVEVAKATDKEVGDGTTSAVVLAGKLLEKAEGLLNKDVHPTIITEGYRKATSKALELCNEIAISIKAEDRGMLKKIAMTAMASKLVRENRDQLADITVDAILRVAEKMDGGYKVDIDDVDVQKKEGESLSETRLIEGIAIDKEVVHPGMPKSIKNGKIALINSALEIEKTEFTSKIHIERPEEIKAFLDEEERTMRDMVEKIAASGANVVLCQKGIDDIVQHLLAKKGILTVRRVKKSSMEKLAKAIGGKLVTEIEEMSSKDLGKAKLVEERRLGEDKWIFVEGCKDPKAVTILIRGGTEKTIDEAERSIHDALSVVRDVVIEPKVVAGGGAPEMEVAIRLRKWAGKLSGREQLAAMEYADSLEVIPITLAENAGLDPIDVLAELRERHEKGEKWAGVDVFGGKVEDIVKLDVYEPLAVKEQIIKSAAEAACMILRIDDVIASSKAAGAAPPKEGGYEGEE